MRSVIFTLSESAVRAPILRTGQLIGYVEDQVVQLPGGTDSVKATYQLASDLNVTGTPA